MESEKEAFEKLVGKRERMLMNAQRLALIELDRDPEYSDGLWWNKIASMGEEEMEMLPLGFTIKYGTFLVKQQENLLLTEQEASRRFENRHDRVKNLDRLLTDEEIALREQAKEDNVRQPVNDPNNYELTNYMKRQPRMDLRVRNFNFEEYKPYIEMYEDSRTKDEEDSKNFYKLVKYVLARKGTDEERTNSTVKEFLKKYHVDLIEIPEEFKDL